LQVAVSLVAYPMSARLEVQANVQAVFISVFEM